MSDRPTAPNTTSADAEAEQTPDALPHWRVETSFDVQAASASEARALVSSDLNGRTIQNYIGDTLGDGRPLAKSSCET